MIPADRVIARARRDVIPPRKDSDKMNALAEQFLDRTRKAADAYTETRGVMMGGSFAKGTWLAREVDLDIFVKIDTSVTDERFEEVGLAVGRRAARGLPTGKKFAQHPYTEALAGDVKVNIVPCYDVREGEWRSAADRSPFHVKVVAGLPEEKKTEVRLLKRFMKSVRVYGAEIETQGFSGYVTEVLVIRFGSFKAALKWFSSLQFRPRGNPLSLPDPVDGGRDLGVAISAEKLGRMVLASREFLRRPSPAFFRAMREKTRGGKRPEVYAIAFSHERLSEDTLWGELRRTARHIVSHVESKGFAVARWMAASNDSDRSAILMIPEFTSLPEMEQRKGPTVDRRDDVRAFIESNSRESRLVWVDDDARVRALRPRAYVELEALLVDLVRGKGGETGASRELGAGLRRDGTVLHGASLIREAEASPWLGAGIREITEDAIGTRKP